MSGWLKVIVMQGRNLLGTDSTGYSDPLVRVCADNLAAPMIDSQGNMTVTSSQFQTLNPVWMKTFQVRTNKQKGSLRFECWDKANIVGSETFMGSATIDIGVGSTLGSAGELWIPLKPREGNESDQKAWDAQQKKGKSFGELLVKWSWTYSSLGQLLRSDDLNIQLQDERPPAAYSAGGLTVEITRLSNWLFVLCTPWFWLSERFMWQRPYESAFVLSLITYVCVYDLLSQCFFLVMFILLVKWYLHRARHGPFGEPTYDDSEGGVYYPNPFAWMTAFSDLTAQLQMTQNLCTMIANNCDYVVEILTWERQDSALKLSQGLLLWSILAYFGLFPPFRYILLISFWYMFTSYPLMMNYPRAYNVIAPESIIFNIIALVSGGSDKNNEQQEDDGEDEAEPVAESAKPPKELTTKCILRTLEANKSDGWTVAQVKGDCTYEKMKVKYCTTEASRFSGVMNCSAETFAHFMHDEENVKKFDTLLKELKVIDEKPGKLIVYTAFKSPIPFITCRDMLTEETSRTLNSSEAAEWGLKAPSNSPTRSDPFEIDGIENNYAFVTCGISVKHKKCPPAKGYIRGTVQMYGWICEPINESQCKVSMLMAIEPNGMIPNKAVDITNSEQIEKWKIVKGLVEKEQKKAKKAPTTTPATSKTTVSPSTKDDASLAKCIVRTLEANKSKDWIVSQNKDGCKFEKQLFSYCTTEAARFSGVMNCSSETFCSFITDASRAYEYDNLLKELKEIEHLPNRNIVYAAFKSPIPFITCRDMLTEEVTRTLNPNEAAQWDLQAPSDSAPRTEPFDLKGFDNSYVVVSCGMSVKHKKCPPAKGYVRGTVQMYGWICEPINESQCKVSMLMAIEPNGMIPNKAVDITNSEQIEKWKIVKGLVEKEQKKKQ
eukprot:TRINITY_DN2724_c0_g1_i1.p1 TRINITY_DN2724_c0_g1~~TRINITY_DN2724_c0_g1_i1.p1  ORF type:complete len:888 (+),score=140.11 TRINITY_DN2724_c0_g1_i1:61-2724(+)